MSVLMLPPPTETSVFRSRTIFVGSQRLPSAESMATADRASEAFYTAWEASLPTVRIPANAGPTKAPARRAGRVLGSS